jgi:hypothetical protein
MIPTPTLGSPRTDARYYKAIISPFALSSFVEGLLKIFTSGSAKDFGRDSSLRYAAFKMTTPKLGRPNVEKNVGLSSHALRLRNPFDRQTVSQSAQSLDVMLSKAKHLAFSSG